MGMLPMLLESELAPTRADSVPGLLERVREVDAAVSSARVPVQYLGVAPLFDETRVYPGDGADWVISPGEDDAMVDGPGRFPIPARERRRLQRLVHAGARFPDIYIAHEIEPVLSNPVLPLAGSPGATASSALVPSGRGYAVAPPVLARQLVGTPPPAVRTRWLSQRLGTASATVGRASLAAGRAALRMEAVGVTALASVAAVVLADPMVIGAVPASDEAGPGAPAAFYLLAQWHW